ncbi:unnamed protein product [Angiostrongylus costaricensis]|uniref:Mediator of RNA polymerase II transcription subunit 13 n=1 Tax=Angiostrongylus costaricensis TaxID=334426 RepID=A0A158PKG7_ANGCS|nr:unnamed protein product [Angiostrongylus costaricensis]
MGKLWSGLQNAGTNAFMSTLQQLSGLSAPLLPGSALGAAQWANSQSAGQTWIDPAKVAAMLPMYQVFTGVKGLKISQSELIGQQNIAPLSNATLAATSSSSIFPTTITKRSLRKSPSISGSPQLSQNSPVGGPLSSGPSSHPSTSTPQDIDVGVLSHPSSQTHAYDLTVRSSPARTPDEGNRSTQDFSTRSSSSFKTGSAALATIHPESHPSTSQSSGQQPTVDDNWAGIDLGDLDLFTGPSSKENEAAISNVFELGGNLFPDSFNESPQKTTSFSSATISQPTVNHSEIAAADQEFDQIFSSLENNTASTNAFPFDFHGGENHPSLSPVQFTPPDSPTACPPDPNIIGLFGGPSTSSAAIPSLSPFITSQTSTSSTSNSKRKADSVKPIAAPSPSSFKKEPLVTRPVQKCNKIPVYKQRKFTAIISNDANETKDASDAYSFEDDEEVFGLGHVDPKEKLDVEVREKLSKIAGQHPEMRNKNVYVPGVGFAIPPDQQVTFVLIIRMLFHKVSNVRNYSKIFGDM